MQYCVHMYSAHIQYMYAHVCYYISLHAKCTLHNENETLSAAQIQFCCLETSRQTHNIEALEAKLSIRIFYRTFCIRLNSRIVESQIVLAATLHYSNRLQLDY